MDGRKVQVVVNDLVSSLEGARFLVVGEAGRNDGLNRRHVRQKRHRSRTKERIQQYQGVVLQRKSIGSSQTFTVRKISNGVGVERIFPLFSPKIDKIVVDKKGVVRRAKIFYLRGISGKKARIEEKKV